VLDNYLILDFSMFVMFVIVIGSSIAYMGHDGMLCALGNE
jgi:hypothetical protein